MEFENSTVQEVHSGEQAGAVAPQEESPTAAAGQDEVVAHQQGDFAMVDTDAETAEDAPKPTEPVKQAQSREENAAIRAARIRARREAEAAAAKAADEGIASSGVINPYTKEPFRSVQEFRDYGKRVRQAEIAKAAKETGRSVEELENNQKFRRFCGSRFGREPLAELYGAYLEVVGTAGAAAVAKAAGRQQRSTGGGTAGGAALTPTQKAVLDRWNEEHPEMAMTAKEFLGR